MSAKPWLASPTEVEVACGAQGVVHSACALEKGGGAWQPVVAAFAQSHRPTGGAPTAQQRHAALSLGHTVISFSTRATSMTLAPCPCCACEGLWRMCNCLHIIDRTAGGHLFCLRSKGTYNACTSDADVEAMSQLLGQPEVE